MMKWEAEAKGYTCNDCYLSMQNCHDIRICCEDETELCDWFEKNETGGRVMQIIYTCPNCGCDLQHYEICTNPPIPGKYCLNCGAEMRKTEA